MHYKFIKNNSNHYITQILSYLFRSIGKTCDIVDVYKSKDDTNENIVYIITFPQHVDPMPKRYIVYQLEQLQQSLYGKSHMYQTKLSNAMLCLDYSMTNINANKTRGIIQKWLPVPIAHIPSVFCHEVPSDESRIDVLFYGSLNHRRTLILQYLNHVLKSQGYSLIVVHNTLFGEDLYKCIRRSRVVLNIGYYKDTLLATYRLNEVLVHQRIVVSEKSAHTSDSDIMAQYEKGGVVFIDKIDEQLSNIHSILVKPVVQLLQNPTFYHSCVKRGKQFIYEKEMFFKIMLHQYVSTLS